MAMNFWEAQKRARSKTWLYISLFIILTLVVAGLAELAMHYFVSEEYYSSSFPFIGLIFIAITFTTAAFEYMQFCVHGGSYVAEAVGAYYVEPDTKDSHERRLLNIVEEIAIASSLPIPPVYILDTKQINAFAAGISKDNAAITVTAGTLMLLNRDELQGVVAHEFGHIYNEDMKISMRLAAMCMGFFFILYFALRILQFSGYRDREEKGGNAVVVAAMIFLVAGAFTWVFGSILKAAVSREREYLADACAVQFTRNPNGIANALRKIAHESEAETNEMPKSGMAYSHLYLDDRAGFSQLFATHPPLKKRIEAIEGREYLPEEWKVGL